MKRIVHYFGGYRASLDDVTKWQKSAQDQVSAADFDFSDVYPYPEGATAKEPTAKFNIRPVVTKIANALKASDDQHILHVIMGHSSGALTARKVAEALLELKVANWQLIALDGSGPTHALSRVPTTRFWSAKNNGHPASLNYTSMQAAGKQFRLFQVTPDTTKFAPTSEWSLHFTLVNKNVVDKLTKDNWWKDGNAYKDCKANLDVLDDPGPPPSGGRSK